MTEAEIRKEERELVASLIEGHTRAGIRLHCGEMTAQEMRTVLAVQRWWVAQIRAFGDA